ncbi:MAG: LamG-like jellyroll fold domain-containing protein [Planctomycetota bacterium]
MRLVHLLTAPVLLAAGLRAQTATEILYYRFDIGSGTTVVNHYAASKLAPATGTMVTTAKAAWAKGMFGNCMQGAESGTAYNYVDSGWKGALTGDFTVAWFLKQRTTLPDTLAYYFFSGEGNFRAFTSGAASSGLRVAGWGTDVSLTADIRTPAASRWVHVALVVDGTAKTATFYVDGVAQTPITIAGGANVPARTTNGFRVGAHTRLTTTSWWDMDDFRLVNRAVPEAEVKAWSAAAVGYAKNCGATLLGGGTGTPKVGNAQYGLTLNGAASAPGLLSIGASGTGLGPIPLPLDLGLVFPALQGCPWASSLDILVPIVTPNTGTLSIPYPIPNDVGLVQVALFNQCLLFPLHANPQSSAGFVLTILP